MSVAVGDAVPAPVAQRPRVPAVQRKRGDAGPCDCCHAPETARDSRTGQVKALTHYGRLGMTLAQRRRLCQACQMRTLACNDDVTIAAKVVAFLASLLDPGGQMVRVHDERDEEDTV